MLKCYRNQSHIMIWICPHWPIPKRVSLFNVRPKGKTKKCAKVYGILWWLLVSKCHILLYSPKPIPICVMCVYACGKMTTPCTHTHIGKKGESCTTCSQFQSSFINFIYIYATSIFSHVCLTSHLSPSYLNSHPRSIFGGEKARKKPTLQWSIWEVDSNESQLWIWNPLENHFVTGYRVFSVPFYQIPGISIHTRQYAIPIKVCVFVAPTEIFEKWKFLWADSHTLTRTFDVVFPCKIVYSVSARGNECGGERCGGGSQNTHITHFRKCVLFDCSDIVNCVWAVSACMCCAYTHKLFIVSNVKGNGPNLNEYKNAHTNRNRRHDSALLRYYIHNGGAWHTGFRFGIPKKQ